MPSFPDMCNGDAPSLGAIQPVTNARAARVEERCSHRVVGYVLQHRALQKRSIVVDGKVRWFPNDEEFQSMMGWKKYQPGPGVPHEGWPLDETPAPEPAAAPIQVAPVPRRSVLTAPPTAKLLESTEEALGELALALGCVRNEEISHNAGWFVPGKSTAYASAYDAIRGLVASLEAGGTIYRSQPGAPAAASAAPVPEAKCRTVEESSLSQGALF